MIYYIVHSGVSVRDGAKVGSGRYRLGSGERPFQRYIEGRRLKKQQKRQEEWNKKKEDIIKNGTSKQVLAISDKLTTAELQAAYQRLQAKQNIANVQDSMFYKVDRAMAKLNKINNWYNTGSNTLRILQNIGNSLSGKKEEEKKKNEYVTKSDLGKLQKSIEDTVKEAARNVDKKEEKKNRKDRKILDNLRNKINNEQEAPKNKKDKEIFETWNVKWDEVIDPKVTPITDYSRLLEAPKSKKKKRKK